MKSPFRLLLADDHATVRQGLKLLIDSQPDMRVIGEATDGQHVIEQARALQPDIVIMDISMPGINGLTATRTVKREHPHISIIALTRHDDQSYLDELLRAGSSGYVLKQSAPTELLQAVRAVALGGIYLDPAMTSRAAERMLSGNNANSTPRRRSISERESEVLRLIAIGHSNKEIGALLNISVKTVEVHKANAVRKLGLTGRVSIVRYGVLQGWLHDA
jgi:DNA-binding NarL/FixJ family response regulator